MAKINDFLNLVTFFGGRTVVTLIFEYGLGQSYDKVSLELFYKATNSCFENWNMLLDYFLWSYGWKWWFSELYISRFSMVERLSLWFVIMNWARVTLIRELIFVVRSFEIFCGNVKFCGFLTWKKIRAVLWIIPYTFVFCI